MSEIKEEKKYKLKINILGQEPYESKEYDGEILLGTVLQDFVNIHTYYLGGIVFSKGLLLGYDISMTIKLKDIQIDLTSLLGVVATLGPLHGKNRFGLLENSLAMFNSGLLWPPFPLNENEDPISFENLGEVDMKLIKTIDEFDKFRNGFENTNAPNLVILEIPVENKENKIVRKTVHKLTYLKSLYTTVNKCPLTNIIISDKFKNIL